MNITVRLWRSHDYDLIQLYKNTGFPVNDALKTALRNQVRNTPAYFEYPQTVYNEDFIPKSLQFHLKLDDFEDADIIAYLSDIKDGFRNSFLKNLLRASFICPIAYPYKTDLDYQNEERYRKQKNEAVPVTTFQDIKKRRR